MSGLKHSSEENIRSGHGRWHRSGEARELARGGRAILMGIALLVVVAGLTGSQARAEQTVIYRPGVAVSSWDPNHDEYDLEGSDCDTSGPNRGIVLGWDISSRPTYRFIVPPPVTSSGNLSRVTLIIDGNGPTLADPAVLYVNGVNYGELSGGENWHDWFSDTAPSLPVYDQSIDAWVINVTIDATNWRWYDLCSVELRFWHGLPQDWVEMYLWDIGAALAIEGYDAEIGSDWGEDLGDPRNRAYADAMQEFQGTAMSLWEMNSGGLFDAFDHFADILQDFINVMEDVQNWFYWEAFWLGYDHQNYSFDNKLVNAANSLDALAMEWHAVIEDGSIDGRLGDLLTLAQTARSDVNFAHGRTQSIADHLHTIYPNTDITEEIAPLAMEMLSPLIDFNVDTGQLNEDTSYLYQLVGELDRQISYIEGQIPETYTVTVSAGAHGSVSPDGAVSVVEGDDLVVTADPENGYEVDEWYLDGVPVQDGGVVRLESDIRADHALHVTFAVSTGGQLIIMEPAPDVFMTSESSTMFHGHAPDNTAYVRWTNTASDETEETSDDPGPLWGDRVSLDDGENLIIVRAYDSGDNVIASASKLVIRTNDVQEMSFSSIEAAFVGSGRPNSNFGMGVVMVGAERSGGQYETGVQRGLVQFDLSSLPVGCDVVSAQFRGEAIPGFANGGPMNISIYRATGPWDEDTVTWNSKPGYASGWSDTLPLRLGLMAYAIHVNAVPNACRDATRPGSRYNRVACGVGSPLVRGSATHRTFLRHRLPERRGGGLLPSISPAMRRGGGPDPPASGHRFTMSCCIRLVRVDLRGAQSLFAAVASGVPAGGHPEN